MYNISNLNPHLHERITQTITNIKNCLYVFLQIIFTAI